MNPLRIVDRLLAEEKPIRFLLSRILAETGLSVSLGLQIKRPGWKLHFFNTSLSMTLWLDKATRLEDIEVIQGLLPSSGTYVDIGANIGDLTLAGATAVGRAGRVLAFEAHPRTFALLLKNLRLNGFGNVFPVNAACGEAFGWTRFTDRRSDDMNRVDTDGMVVPVIPAATLIPEGTVDLLKIDVEGFELFVLKGLQPTLSRTDHVLIEVGDRLFAQYGYSFGDVYDLLASEGFLLIRRELSNGVYSWTKTTERDHVFLEVENIIATRRPNDLLRLARSLSS
ncbi:MAG: FkbM family methyltransferase [Gammaproteobacteria bacterium]|nr:FkbM family methyltransferase [Gammaproteobacteria bacterium]